MKIPNLSTQHLYQSIYPFMREAPSNQPYAELHGVPTDHHFGGLCRATKDHRNVRILHVALVLRSNTWGILEILACRILLFV